MIASCEQVLRKIDAYLDGELGEPDAGALAKHLKDCPECLQQGVFLSRLRAVIRHKLRAGPDLPAEILDRIRSSITDSGGL